MKLSSAILAAGFAAFSEEISLAYQAITVTFPPTGRTAAESGSR